MNIIILYFNGILCKLTLQLRNILLNNALIIFELFISSYFYIEYNYYYTYININIRVLEII